MPILSVNLGLNQLCDPRCVAEEDVRVIEEQAADVDGCHNPIPVHCLDEELEGDNMD